MKIDILTLFPEYFKSPLNESLIKKAIDQGLLEVNIHNLRDFSTLPHRQVDDTPYGGGAGMVLKPEILAQAVHHIKKTESLVILPDPSGVKFEQKLAKKLSTEKNLLFICGRYEGVDQRFKEKYVDLEISLGDYVLNGGEAATLVIFETVARLIPNVLGNPESVQDESFSDPSQLLLEYPQYTRPEIFEGLEVPKVLLSGNHQEIEDWRRNQAISKTKKLRPDLF